MKNRPLFAQYHSQKRALSSYEICSVCGWEDDPAQASDSDLAGGANRESLNHARANWRQQEQSLTLSHIRYIFN